MRAVCLTLPTNRGCARTIAAVAEEAEYAARTFDVEVHLLVLDSAGERDRAAHASVLGGIAAPGVVVHHLDEARQHRFLSDVVARSGVAKPELVQELMLPAGVSYGACTNRAFLIGAALGCVSVHRRDSDSRYQTADGAPVFPIRHELLSLGRRARDAATAVTETALDPVDGDKTVVLVGSSFIGDLSVDIAEIRDLDPAVYREVVGLWAAEGATETQRRDLVEKSFTGAGAEPFTADHSVLTIVDPMHVDMCNVAFSRVQERIPLPPAVDTIGSDYFLLHLVRAARLPGVQHNRHIVNFHTAERKTDAGFPAYQRRLAKFFLSMRYLHHVYERMAAAGESLLDGDGHVRPDLVAGFVLESTSLDVAPNARRLDVLDRAYRALGGRYRAVAELLAAQRDRLLEEARRDMADFALLIEAWPRLVEASGTTGVPGR
ncbi:DUF6271 family protein [Kutzneria buriramensis]|uniref:Uncharacterized protein n=1 Tax=Kutzneria buriramensis TaxID=1045776 RepID=A0A3E0GZB2_9PSEU|nr:DUF6271 family protein [Kutzneria buriramensis]REH35675.1 hypothetical protein BCF44_11763 [Kutzneria buriramensis]